MWRCVDPALTDVWESAVCSLLADAVFPLADFSTLKMEAILSSETSVNTASTQRHIPEDDILHSHCCENLKYYICVLMLKYNRNKTAPEIIHQMMNKELKSLLFAIAHGNSNQPN
jgi:hypothetical protein